jgi:hypothetical protein
MPRKKLSAIEQAVKDDARETIGYDARSGVSPLEFAAEVDAGLRDPLPPKKKNKKK